MEFKFSVNEIFKQPIVEINQNLIPPGFTGDRRALWDAVGKVMEVVNAMGEASARAQGLTKPITSSERLRNSDHTLYLLIDQNGANGKGVVTGMLKTGRKGLYIFDRDGQHYQVQPPCILDFYVHESRQRNGLGKQIFEHMLQKEKIEPAKLAIDRPSEKFLGFLNKHYKLKDAIKQMNNYVVYEGFFPKKGEPEKLAENNSGTPERNVAFKHSANGLQSNYPSSPYGRYGAPRPPCSMGQIIHNQSSTMQSSPEQAGQSAPTMAHHQQPIQNQNAEDQTQYVTQTANNFSNNAQQQASQQPQYQDYEAQQRAQMQQYYNQQQQMYPQQGTVQQPQVMQNLQHSASAPQQLQYYTQQGVTTTHQNVVPQDPAQTQAHQTQQQLGTTPRQAYSMPQMSSAAPQLPQTTSQPQAIQQMTSSYQQQPQVVQQMLSTAEAQAPPAQQMMMPSQGQQSVSQQIYPQSVQQLMAPQTTQISANQAQPAVFQTAQEQQQQALYQQQLALQQQALQQQQVLQQQVQQQALQQQAQQYALQQALQQQQSLQEQQALNQQQALQQQAQQYALQQALQLHAQQQQMLEQQAQQEMSVCQMQPATPQMQQQTAAPQTVQSAQMMQPQVTNMQNAQMMASTRSQPAMSQVQMTTAPQGVHQNAQMMLAGQQQQTPAQNVWSSGNAVQTGGQYQRTMQPVAQAEAANRVASPQMQMNVQPAASAPTMHQTTGYAQPQQDQRQGAVQQAYSMPQMNQQTPVRYQYYDSSARVMQQNPIQGVNAYQQISKAPLASGDANLSGSQQYLLEYPASKNPPTTFEPEEGESEIKSRETADAPPRKLERPRSLSIQLSTEEADEKNANEVAVEEAVPEEPEKEVAEENGKEEGGEVEPVVVKLNSDVTGDVVKKTPSHLTEQGFFDLKFYHNKLW